MLLSFTVKNFRSFKDAQSLIMIPQNNLKDYRENIGVNGRYQALKSVAILGHNASGKSNILNALITMGGMLLYFNRNDSDNVLSYEPFAYNTQTINEPTEFEIEFLFQDKKYRYGFRYNKNEIISEWLFAAQNKHGAREQFIFARDKNEYDIKNLKGSSRLREKTRKNILFVSVCAFFDVAEANSIKKWFKDYVFTNHSMFSIISDIGIVDQDVAKSFLNEEDKAERQSILDFIRQADLSIQDISATKNENRSDRISTKDPNVRFDYDVFSRHHIYDDLNSVVDHIDMLFSNTESNGTMKYFNLSKEILNTLTKGGLYIADELDARLHPLLFLNIVKLFNSDKTNPKNAQLILATHNTNLLDIGNMRRDQILFVEKDKGEASKIYPLSQFNVRGGKSFGKSYLFGRYGAIPSLEDIALCKENDISTRD